MTIHQTDRNAAADLHANFWAKVDRRGQDECWPWIGSRIKKGGRGILWAGDRNIVAARISLEIALGRPISDGLLACHTCDNPNCVNPRHLWEGSARDNSRDAQKKGRLFQMDKTTCLRGHTFDDRNTFLNSRGQRQCRACLALRNSKRDRRKSILADAIERGEI